MRVPALSGQPSPVGKTARDTEKSVKKHSTKRQTVQAAGWIDRNTDAYILHRLSEAKKLDDKFTRSKIIAEMLKEQAADDTFFRSQAILAPLIQDVIRSEFRAFTSRFMGVLAKIAYQVGWMLSLLIRYMSLQLNQTTLHDIEVANTGGTNRSVQLLSPDEDKIIRALSTIPGSNGVIEKSLPMSVIMQKTSLGEIRTRVAFRSLWAKRLASALILDSYPNHSSASLRDEGEEYALAMGYAK